MKEFYRFGKGVNSTYRLFKRSGHCYLAIDRCEVGLVQLQLQLTATRIQRLGRPLHPRINTSIATLPASGSGRNCILHKVLHIT